MKEVEGFLGAVEANNYTDPSIYYPIYPSTRETIWIQAARINKGKKAIV
jgi:hypothetical protein